MTDHKHESISPYAEHLEFAIELAQAAGQVILPAFRNGLEIDNKLQSGFDPVTEADRDAETAIRTLIEQKYPDHGIIGEEHGIKKSDSDFNWILDPIDGTRSFISGTPTWMTLIALCYKGEPVAGVACQPFTGEIFAGTTAGSFLLHNDKRQPLTCTSRSSLAEVLAGTTAQHLFIRHGHHQRLENLTQAVRHIRFDADAYFHCMVAAGQLGISLDTGLQCYDIAALMPIVQGAGGIVTTWDGGNAANGGDILVSANADLHQQAMQLLK
ncbi:MAG: inositol monophosphatase family protein [Anderseniella sp.]